ATSICGQSLLGASEEDVLRFQAQCLLCLSGAAETLRWNGSDPHTAIAEREANRPAVRPLPRGLEGRDVPTVTANDQGSPFRMNGEEICRPLVAPRTLTVPVFANRAP